MKHLTLIIGLLWALGASGQIFINSYIFPPTATTQLLLDEFPNAAAGYSLRKLRAAYTGNCVQVRRVSDGALSDIGFAGNYMDTTSLKTFCAGTNCFVRTWYDQSLNARDAVQATDANQPQIVLSGNLYILNNFPAIRFSATVSAMSLVNANFPGSVSYTVSSLFSAFNVSQFTKLISIGPDAATSGVWYTVNTGSTALEWVAKDTGFGGNGFNNPSGPFIVSNGRIVPDSETTSNLLTSTLSASAARMFRNGSEISYRVRRTGNCYNITGNLIIGNRPGNDNHFGGRMQELVIWQSDLNSNLPNINANTNAFYSIY